MTDRKLTDNEIINNIVWCMNPNNACADCPYYELRSSLDCVSSLFRDTLDLINRQNAENERLNFVRTRDAQRYEEKISNQAHTNCVLIDLHSATIKEVKELEEKLKTAKAEAYKECIEKVNSEIHQALESNYKVRAERFEKHNVGETDEFISYCDGKIDCLRGLDDFSDNLLKELVGE